MREPNLDPRVPHGTRSGYQRWKCGCLSCRDWNRTNQNRVRQRKRGEELTPLRAPDPRPGELALVGDDVRHPVLGWGIVLETDGRRLTVCFTGTRRTTRQLDERVFVERRERPPHRRVPRPPERKPPECKPAPSERKPPESRSVLSLAEQLKLANSYHSGASYRDLSEQFNVGVRTVVRMISIHGGPNRVRPLTHRQRGQILALSALGYTMVRIARLMGVSEQTVLRVVRGRR